MSRFVVILFLFLFSLPFVSAQSSEMSIVLAEDGSAHVIISVSNPPNLAELRSIVDEPRVRDIYGEQLGLVFDDLSNLELSVESGVFMISFDSTLASIRDGDLVVEQIVFNDRLASMSMLSISIPDGYEFQSSDPSPTAVSENSVEWRDVDSIPAVSFTKQMPLLTADQTSSLVTALLILAAAAIFVYVWRKRG